MEALGSPGIGGGSLGSGVHLQELRQSQFRGAKRGSHRQGLQGLFSLKHVISPLLVL